MTAIEQDELDRIGSEFSHAAVVHHVRWATTSVTLESTLMLIAQGMLQDPQDAAASALRAVYETAREICGCPERQAP